MGRLGFCRKSSLTFTCVGNFCNKFWSRKQNRMDLMDSGRDSEVKLIASSNMDTKETD